MLLLPLTITNLFSPQENPTFEEKLVKSSIVVNYCYVNEIPGISSWILFGKIKLKKLLPPKNTTCHLISSSSWTRVSSVTSVSPLHLVPSPTTAAGHSASYKIDQKMHRIQCIQNRSISKMEQTYWNCIILL